LASISVPLARAQDLALAVRPRDLGQADAQREMVASLKQALEARRQRIIVSDSGVNGGKWVALLALAIVMLIAIACVHSANRRTALLALSLFATAVAVLLVMLVAQDQPFSGHLGQKPDLLEQVIPDT
jgi:uncharacterized membrane protein YhaH (DUF805 family)